MHCFVHEDKEALGVCKNCLKAVCKDCVRDLQFGIACSEKCAQDVSHTNEMTQKALRLYGIGQYKKTIPDAAIMHLVFGLGFLGFGISMLLKSGLRDASFLLFMGLVFIVFAGIRIFSNKRIKC